MLAGVTQSRFCKVYLLVNLCSSMVHATPFFFTRVTKVGKASEEQSNEPVYHSVMSYGPRKAG